MRQPQKWCKYLMTDSLDWVIIFHIFFNSTSFLRQRQSTGLVSVCRQFERRLRSHHWPADPHHLLHWAAVHAGLLVLHDWLHGRIAASKKQCTVGEECSVSKVTAENSHVFLSHHLQVRLKYGNASHEVWSQSGNQGNKWRRGEVFLGLLNNFQVCKWSRTVERHFNVHYATKLHALKWMLFTSLCSKVGRFGTQNVCVILGVWGILLPHNDFLYCLFSC